MKVILTQDTNVRLKRGDTVEVTEQEAKRLFAFGLAEEAPKPKPKKKKKED